MEVRLAPWQPAAPRKGDERLGGTREGGQGRQGLRETAEGIPHPGELGLWVGDAMGLIAYGPYIWFSVNPKKTISNLQKKII